MIKCLTNYPIGIIRDLVTFSVINGLNFHIWCTHSLTTYTFYMAIRNLTHWGRDKMATISQMTLSKPIFLNENIQIPIKIWLKFVPKAPINNIPTMVQIMAWRRPGDKPLSETMMVCLLTHICITRPQWVKSLSPLLQGWGMRQPQHISPVHNKHNNGLNCLSSVLPSKMGQPQHVSPEFNQGWYCWSYLLYK